MEENKTINLNIETPGELPGEKSGPLLEETQTNEAPRATDPENIPRLPDGKIDVETISTGKNEKGFYIVPDEIFNTYYQELPAGTINTSKTWRATATGGKIKIFGGDPEADRAIQIKGAETVNAARAQRRSIKEILEDLSRKTVTAEEAEQYGLKEGTTLLEAANLAQIRRAMKGDTKAAEYVRDTLGEKPADRISAEVTGLTPEDRQLIENVGRRLGQETTISSD